MAAYKNKVRVAAHRGNSCVCPENTLVAMRSALELPVDMLEIDLHMTKDGHIILMHDHAVDRTTDHTGLIRDYTLAQIRAMDAGSWKGEAFRGERVPLFEEFLELLKDYPDMTFNVELKDYPLEAENWPLDTARAWARESADKAIALVEQYGIAERVWFNCWSGELLEYVDAAYGHRYKLHGYFPFELMHGVKTRAPYDYLHCVCLFARATRLSWPRRNSTARRRAALNPGAFSRATRRNIMRAPSPTAACCSRATIRPRRSPICGNEDCTTDICGLARAEGAFASRLREDKGI